MRAHVLLGILLMIIAAVFFHACGGGDDDDQREGTVADDDDNGSPTENDDDASTDDDDSTQPEIAGLCFYLCFNVTMEGDQLWGHVGCDDAETCPAEAGLEIFKKLFPNYPWETSVSCEQIVTEFVCKDGTDIHYQYIGGCTEDGDAYSPPGCEPGWLPED